MAKNLNSKYNLIFSLILGVVLAIAVSVGATSIGTNVDVTGNVTVAGNIAVNSSSATSTFAGGLTVDSSTLVVDHQTGRVGIGTANPSYLLHLVATGYPRFQIETSDNTTDSQAILSTQADNPRVSTIAHASARTITRYGITLGGWGEISLAQNSALPGGLILGTIAAVPMVFGTDNVERMRILSTGNVGIGTSTPNRLLQIAGNAGPQLLLTQPGAGSNLKHWYASTTAGSLTFGTLTDDLSTLTERLRIGSDGRMGIGTTTPSTLFQVATSTANATTTIELGKANQNKGTCMKLYDAVGTLYYCSVQGGTFTCLTTSCE